MQLTFEPMSEQAAREIVGWRYGGEYSLYDDAGEEDVKLFADPDNRYAAIYDGDLLVGYYCLGEDAQVPGGDYAADALDVGMGLHPDLTGRGLGAAILAAVLDHVREQQAVAAFRATVAAFNRRAQRLCQRVGFEVVNQFTSTVGNRLEFVLMIKPA